MRWKALIEMEKQQQDQVDRNIKEAREKLEMEMEAARHEHQVMLMRQGEYGLRPGKRTGSLHRFGGSFVVIGRERPGPLSLSLSSVRSLLLSLEVWRRDRALRRGHWWLRLPSGKPGPSDGHSGLRDQIPFAFRICDYGRLPGPCEDNDEYSRPLRRCRSDAAPGGASEDGGAAQPGSAEAEAAGAQVTLFR